MVGGGGEGGEPARANRPRSMSGRRRRRRRRRPRRSRSCRRSAPASSDSSATVRRRRRRCEGSVSDTEEKAKRAKAVVADLPAKAQSPRRCGPRRWSGRRRRRRRRRSRRPTASRSRASGWPPSRRATARFSGSTPASWSKRMSSRRLEAVTSALPHHACRRTRSARSRRATSRRWRVSDPLCPLRQAADDPARRPRGPIESRAELDGVSAPCEREHCGRRRRRGAAPAAPVVASPVRRGGGDRRRRLRGGAGRGRDGVAGGAGATPPTALGGLDGAIAPLGIASTGRPEHVAALRLRGSSGRSTPAAVAAPADGGGRRHGEAAAAVEVVKAD